MTGTGTLALIITAVAGLLTGGTALINSLLSRPKVRAETMRIATEAATEQLQNLRLDNKELRERVDLLEAKLDAADVKLTAANLTNADLQQQNKLLMRYLSKLTKWVKRNYREGHPPGIEPPPELYPHPLEDTL